MPWVLLVAAIGTEVAGTSLLKAADGFSKLVPTLGVVVAYIASFLLLGVVVKHIPVGVTYAVWSGLGTAGIVAIGAAFLDEPLSVVKIAGIGLIVAGVVVLNVGGAH